MTLPRPIEGEVTAQDHSIRLFPDCFLDEGIDELLGIEHDLPVGIIDNLTEVCAMICQCRCDVVKICRYHQG